MGSSSWNKKEEKIVKNNFSTAKWEDLLGMIPEKTKKQIINKANKLGIKREREVVDLFYDDEKGAWVETTVSYNGSKFKVNSIIPAPKGKTFEETKERVSLKVSKVFAEMIAPRYMELINTLSIHHSKELYSIFFDMQKAARYK
jgi:hypothetical protein